MRKPIVYIHGGLAHQIRRKQFDHLIWPLIQFNWNLTPSYFFLKSVQFLSYLIFGLQKTIYIQKKALCNLSTPWCNPLFYIQKGVTPSDGSVWQTILVIWLFWLHSHRKELLWLKFTTQPGGHHLISKAKCLYSSAIHVNRNFVWKQQSSVTWGSYHSWTNFCNFFILIINTFQRFIFYLRI